MQNPFRKATRTAQDLMLVVMRNYDEFVERHGLKLPSKSRLARAAFESPLMAVGRAMAHAMEFLPAKWVFDFHDRIYSALASPLHLEFNESSPEILRARALADTLEQETGRTPALLALLSHPLTTGEESLLNFELVRLGSRALCSLREKSAKPKPCRPRLLIAVDPFALDTAPLYQEALYSGIMGTYHVGLDRLALNRSALNQELLAPARWDRTAYRLMSVLSSGGEVVQVLAGGVPVTTRLLYAAREWVGRAWRQSPRRDPEALLTEIKNDPLYRRSLEKNPAAQSRSAWRLLQGWAMTALGEPEESLGGISCAEAGKIAGSARLALERILDILGYSKDQARASLSTLDEEFARETPYRERFFETLAERIVARGRPLLILPLTHEIKGGMNVRIKDAWGVSQFENGRLTVLAPPSFEAKTMSPEEFARAFGRSNFI